MKSVPHPLTCCFNISVLCNILARFEEGMLSKYDLHTAAQALLESRIKELQMQMLLIIKQRLVAYYQGENLIR